MSNQFAKHFIFHRYIRLAANRIAEFSFDHAESRLNIAPLMVSRQKLIPMQIEIMEHLVPDAIARRRGIALERNERSSARVRNRLEVAFAEIAQARRDFVDREVLFGGFEHWRQQRSVIAVLLVNLDGRNGVRFHTRHNMRLDPGSLELVFAEFVVVPSLESTTGESRRVASEIRFENLERNGRLDHKRLEQIERRGRFQDIENRGVVRRATDETLVEGIAKIARKSPARDGRVDLEHGRENQVAVRDAVRAALRRSRQVGNTLAQVAEQNLEFQLLVLLGSVVRGPILCVGLALDGLSQRFRHGHAPVVVFFALNRILHGVDVFAFTSAKLKIVASASRLIGLKNDGVFLSTLSLRRNDPFLAVPLNAALGGNHQTALLSGVHFNPLKVTARIYDKYIRHGVALQGFWYIFLVDSPKFFRGPLWRLSRSQSQRSGWSCCLAAAVDADMNGCREIEAKSRASAPSVKALAGINQSSLNGKRLRDHRRSTTLLNNGGCGNRTHRLTPTPSAVLQTAVAGQTTDHPPLFKSVNRIRGSKP